METKSYLKQIGREDMIPKTAAVSVVNVSVTSRDYIPLLSHISF